MKINRRRRKNIHHDNASSHTSAQTTASKSTLHIELMGHPQYSPYLAPNAFHLLLRITNELLNKLRGQRFSTPKKQLIRSKRLFGRYLNFILKNASKIRSNS